MSAVQQRELLRFEQDLRRLADRLDVEVTTVVKRTSLDIFTRIVRKTPVDKGRARASWNISAGQPDDSVVQEAGGQAGADARAQAKANAFDLSKVQAVFITNALPYIEPLENGHSSQAPRGMVRISLHEVTTFTARLVR